jgi:hypothetical protein
MAGTDLKEFIIRTLGLQENSILNIYLVGSRLYSSMVLKSSDYDVIIVRDSTPAIGELPAVEAVHRKNIDAFILSKAEFTDRLASNIMERMCLSLPVESVLQERYRPQVRMDRKTFFLNATTRHEHTLIKARKFAEKGKDKDARKLLLHAIRDHALAQQLLHSDSVTQFHGLTDDFEYSEYEFLLVVCEEISYAGK